VTPGVDDKLLSLINRDARNSTQTAGFQGLISESVSPLEGIFLASLRAIRRLRGARKAKRPMSTDAAAAPHSNFFARHETLTLVLINAVFLALLLAAGEIAARISTGYDIGYYTEAKAGPDGKLHYPWGVVPVNAQGYLDENFDLASTKPRVGWFGDSVAMGVGAGFPYRISDLVRTSKSDINTWNFARLGAGFESEKAEKIAQEYKLNTVVYLLNLNDILPEAPPQSGGGFVVYNGLSFVKDYLDYFRDRSYLYNYIRTAAKNAIQRLGFEASGYFAFELWPNKSDEVFKSFADRVNTTARDLRAKGVQMCVVIAPYEMQVSEDAARTYGKLGFNWEDGFLEGSAQKKLRGYLDKDLPVYDGLDAFSNRNAPVGNLFVYNAGDKIDWNHPNRAGHAALAKGFLQSNACPFLATK
jgi:hypothetical protein